MSLIVLLAFLTLNLGLAGCSGLVSGNSSTNPAPVAPSITAEPTNQSVTAGQPATFGVTATGTAPLSYQWKKNGASISGATSSSYTTPATTSADNGAQFTVVVSNTAGSVTSSAATLTVSASAVAPSITTQPVNQTVTVGQTATFSVTATGTAPLSYQWKKNGATIAGATSSSYTTPATVSSDNGSTFDVVVSNSAGSATSNVVTLTVNGSGGGGIPPALGWYQIPNTTIQAVAPSASQYPNIQGAEGPSAITADWNSGVADTARNRLIIWGGGHNGYYGNEVYALDLNTLKLTRLNNPTANPVRSCVTANGDGTPNARHTYGGLVYLPTTDQMMVFNGSLACPIGFGPDPLDTWVFNFAGLTWQQLTINGITQGPGNFGGTHYDYLTVGNDAEYDPNTGLVFAKDGGSIFSYNPATKTWATLLAYGSDYNISSTLDTKRKIFLLMGNGQAHKINVSNPANVTGSSFTPTNCGPIYTSTGPGLAYDPVQDRVVGWAGGNTVYLLNLDTNSCTTVTYSGGPPAQQPNGTWGRFRYFPSLGVFALVNDWAQSAYTLRLTASSGTSALQDFQNRCAQPGVIACEGFDKASEFVPATFPNTGLYPSGPSAYIVQDTTMYASGGGSLHFPMTANGAPVQNDNWLQNFCSAHPPASCTPPSFTQNSDFYIQFRYRVDSGYLQNWETCCGSSPKIFDVANHQSSCGQTELTIVDRNGTGLQSGYGNCGGYGFDVWPATGLFKGLSAPSYPLSFQSGYYNCEETPTGNVPHPPGGCFTMPANTWMTFYEHVHIGTYNQSNSVFELWVSTGTGPLQYLIKINDFIMPPADTSGYDAIWFNVFMTGFRGNNQAANVWLDEVIVSTQPIPAPQVAPAVL